MKRKTMSTHSDNVKSKKRQSKSILKLENAPEVNSIKDLIEIGKSIKLYKNIDTVMLWRITPYLEQLDRMIGMKSLKKTIFYQAIYYLKGMHNMNKNDEYLHTLIIGPPGHGKTEVAKIIGKIYQSMGILSHSGKFKIAYRDDFIAEYLGQTAIKTRKLLESCLGGILFVDELYSLGPGVKDRDSFSKEALDTLTGFLSEHKNDFCFIGAGYEDDIKKCFIGGNKGLSRRFQWIHRINKYTPEELTDISIKMIKQMNWHISMDKKDIVSVIKKEKNLFKNAGGDVENFISKMKMFHAKRIFSLDSEHMYVFTKEDLLGAVKLSKKNILHSEKEDHPPYGMYI